MEKANPYYKQPVFLVAAGFIALAICMTLVLFFTQPKQVTKTVTVKKPSSAVVTNGIVGTKLLTSGLKMPTSIVAGPSKNDKRLFITQLEGTIVIVSATGQLETKPVLDISSKVLADGEQGLLSIAFDPNFATNGFLYVNYIDKGQNTIITRYKANADGVTADPASEKILFKIKQPYPNHNGGELIFGPDGYLYAALGDGGDAGDPGNRAQDKSSYFGKILRIDVHNGDPYSVPKTNPFVSDASAKPEIWAYGLRNPWRASFDKATGDFYIADVGQSAVEEINMQPASSKGGENYGWRCYEGNQPYNAAGCQDISKYTAPILNYTHDEGRCSVSGGYVYRGTKYPSLVGKYIYTDYCGAQLYAASKVNGVWQSTQVANLAFGASSFGQDSSGELYVADYLGGKLYAIQETAK